MTSENPHNFSARPRRAHEIPWVEWGAEAFERARAEDKPVLLCISAVWCHWCHVMDETTYSDEHVIELLRDRYVPVRVDADMRPDVSARYQVGDWPTTAFLSPGGEPISSLTYLPPDRMLDLLGRINEQWVVNRELVEEQIERLRATRTEREAGQGGGELSPAIYEAALGAVNDSYDAEHGGFGGEPKFPHPWAIRLLLYHHRRDGDALALERARSTFQRMAGGDLYDRVEGGFFRYATQRDWSAPHFEKIAGDHGPLLLALADLGAATDDALGPALDLVEPSIDYLERVLSAPDGGWYGAQDADEAYYALGAEGRSEWPAPNVDTRVYASSTASLARGYLACGVAFDRSEWTARGLAAVDFLWSHLRRGEAGMYRVWDGVPRLPGVLADQAETLLVLLDAYEVTGEFGYLDHAQELIRIVERRWAAPGGGFFDLAADHEAVALLAIRERPLDENAALAEALTRLGRLTHDERYLESARATLGRFAGDAGTSDLRGARYALAVERLIRIEPEIKIIAGVEAEARALHARALRLRVPARTVQRLELERDDVLIAQLGLPGDVVGVAYVCVGHARSAAVSGPDDLAGAVDAAVSEPAF